MSRRTRSLALVVAALLLAALFLLWRSRQPPVIAALLPEADALVYANLKPLRLATHFDQSAPPRSPEFQSFVDATGIVPERDLDEVAFALTRRAEPDGPDGPVAYSEIFRGRFDAARLVSYLDRQAMRREQYAGHTLYTLPAEGGEARLLRVAVLRPGMLAVSNAATAEQIHGMIDHAADSWLSRRQPALLREHFGEVPSLASAWAMGSIGLPFAEGGHVSLLGLDLPLPADQPMVASLRYLGVLRLRVAAIAPTPELAMQQTGALTGMVGLLRTLGAGRSADPQIAAALDSITVAQSGNRTVLTAALPVALFHGMAARH